MSQKVLVKAQPKGKQLDNLLDLEITRTITLPVERQILTHSFVTYMEHSKPVFLLYNSGQQTAREAHGNAGMGLQRKRRPFCNETDRD